MYDKVLLDVCCGRWGWSKEFARRGWKCIGIDLLEHEVPPENCKLIHMNLLALTVEMIKKWDVTFAVASTPCEEFSKTQKGGGTGCFYKNPPFPELGIRLFWHFQELCKAARVPYLMENVKGAEQWMGDSIAHCGPFYLWGNSVPLLLPRGIKKGTTNMSNWNHNETLGPQKSPAELATIPPLLAACVADYAERLLEQKGAASHV